MTHFVYLIRHGHAEPHDGPLSAAGREQARLTGQRLRNVPLDAIYHGPLERAAQTASIIASGFPGVPASASDLVGDYIPADPDLTDLPGDFAQFVRGYDASERAGGRKLAAAAIGRFARAESSGAETHELIVTHNLLIGWFVCQAMAAPDWRWLGVNQMNCGLTVIAYRQASPPSLIMFNDGGHLPEELRWTGFPRSFLP
jgi:probable phosphoglycerate mutase